MSQNGEKEKNTETARKVPCLVMSRIVGYMTPTSGWNDGKLQEFKERKMFTIPDEVKNAN